MWVGKPGLNPRQSSSSVLTLKLWAIGGIYPPTHPHCTEKGASLVFSVSERSCQVSRRQQENLNDMLGLWWGKWVRKSWPYIWVWLVTLGGDRIGTKKMNIRADGHSALSLWQWQEKRYLHVPAQWVSGGVPSCGVFVHIPHCPAQRGGSHVFVVVFMSASYQIKGV